MTAPINDLKSFEVIFDKNLSVEKRKILTDAIRVLPKVKGTELRDDKSSRRRLTVVLSDGRSRERVMRAIEKMPGVFTVFASAFLDLTPPNIDDMILCNRCHHHA